MKLGRYALAVALAVLLIAAPSAAAVEFHSEGANTTIKATQITTQQFFFDTGEFKCSKASASEFVNPTTWSTLTLHPGFSSCTSFGFTAAVAMNDCSYLIHIGGTFDIQCPAGKVAEFSSVFCTVTVSSQTGLKSYSHTNLGFGSSRTVILHFGATGVDYEEHGVLCENGTEQTDNGVFGGSIELRGFTAGGVQRGIWIS
ncbi:MAG TPA: hypothetical protein VFI03_00125 [Solirubrobacterales bacterium]|nr:hypothetical protein [Solirubrobacterales bacterium]